RDYKVTGVQTCALPIFATNTGQAIAPHLMKLGFDPLKLQPVGLIVVVPNVLVVGAVVPVHGVNDLVAAAKAKPGEYKFASSGVRSEERRVGKECRCGWG